MTSTMNKPPLESKITDPEVFANGIDLETTDAAII